jgi:citronellol/citronellal dehydrogenase
MSADRFQSIFRPDLFDGQTILITGGGTGIGRCTAHEFAALGAQVLIGGRRKEPLDETAGEIAAAGGVAHTFQMDIRDDEQVDATIASLVAEHGPIHGLFNNAGGQFVSTADKMSAKGWRAVIDLNLNGTFVVSTAVFRHSMEEHGGSVVNMLADIWNGYPGMSHMSAARAGIENLSISLAMEWAASGVRVNCVAPGTILSSGVLTYPIEVQRRTATEGRDLVSARLGTESEVSAAIVYLMSPAAAYITGDTIKVDGGERFKKGHFIKIGGHDRCRAWNGFHLRPDFSGTPFEDA